MAEETCKRRLGKIMLEQMEIISQSEIAPRIFSIELAGEMVLEMQPGQFLHMRVPDEAKLLRRPISISAIDKEKKIARLIYRVEGDGTRIFSRMQPGQRIDCMGPQGNGFDVSGLGAKDKVLIIGGGIGVPPLVEVAKVLHARGVEVTSVLGFGTATSVILEEELQCYGRVLVTTDDGSYGQQGYVSQVVDQLSEEFSAVYACGAPGMLAYVNQAFEHHPRAYISMEARMACGMGACYACVVHPKDQGAAAHKRVCEEGPVFQTGTIMV
ncbi:dihydroorotate dehydrogenase electron transfer subunit [Streptococcus himalayensis]|uniref:Dihydroorotate dehydrogenase B (NAD(+)), electron transfer subunit n=1 Tax=Streptococcus himalayensis TaxID=1888195 RepID=A0A917EF88_9STRE|nr:dihydroorotate dehydrogenase electron transfer subunit [Streptococcus himalayensis]GGE27507.1 dihydroorotate dehydrogenase B (NAD(+)), electron transfer subunit [Streptococcus himalayensis]